MKAISLIFLAIMLLCPLVAQDITGQWNGMLDVYGQKLRIVFHITESESGLTSTMDSPDQQAFGLATKSTVYENAVLTIIVDTPAIEYTAGLEDGVFKGIFKQAGYEFPLDLTREELPKPVYIRPQEPKEPYPYYSEEVTFTNAEAGIDFAGTLTLPKQEGVFPAVVMITGSGAQNRDEELLGHKPFLVIADYLTRNGIAVLRYDDRGAGESGGDFRSATTADFATDVESAVKYLKTRKEIGDIGLAGHSEGGIIAPMVAASTPEVKFIVLLAGTGIRGDKLLLLQEELIMKASKYPKEEIKQTLFVNRGIYDLVLKSDNTDSLKIQMADFMKKCVADGTYTLPSDVDQEEMLQQAVAQLTSPWMLNFIKYDPFLILKDVHCPVLALNGTKDLQVPAGINLKEIKKGLKKGGNKDVTTVKFKGLNHLFQYSKTGSPDEYAQIEETFSPKALETMSKWIKEKTGLK
jgi:uncharacterized protein